jgi:hypothetical protein
MAQETLAVKGYRNLMRALATAEKEDRLAVRAVLRQVGEQTRTGAQTRLAAKAPKSAAGYKVRVRQRGVAVEQSLRKTTGVHPEWGAYQMRHALLPSLAANADETERLMRVALDAVTERFNRGGPVL